MKNKKLKTIISVAALIACIVGSSIYVRAVHINGYIMTLVNVSLVYCCVVLGICLLLGLGGMLTFSCMVYMGMGSYVVGVLTTKVGVDPLLTVIIAPIFTALFAYILGRILLKLNGTFFMFADMGIMYVLTNVYGFWTEVTGGAIGIQGIPKLDVFGFIFNTKERWFTLFITVTLLLVVAVLRIRKTEFGRSLMAVRDDQIAAQTLGVNVYRTKYIAYTLAATFAGFIGGLYALNVGTLSASLFQYNIVVNCITMAVVGGMQSPFGILFASFVITILPEVLRVAGEYMRLINGFLVIIMMIFLPTGLAGLVSDTYKKIVRKIKKGKASKTNKEVQA